jgi:hypothetical protein
VLRKQREGGRAHSFWRAGITFLLTRDKLYDVVWSDPMTSSAKLTYAKLKPSLSAFIDRLHLWQALYLSNKTCEQGRGIVPSPHQSKRQRHVQIDHA